MRSKGQYWERKEQGVCCRCGKRPPAEGHVYCEECREKAKKEWAKNKDAYMHSEKRREANLRSRKKRYYALIDNGMCGICGKRPLMAGSKCMCAECAEKNRERLRQKRLRQTLQEAGYHGSW